jgi:L-aspartate oxidase
MAPTAWLRIPCLKGWFFGARAAQAMLADGLPVLPVAEPAAAARQITKEDNVHADVYVHRLQRAMWAYAGLLRHESTLRQGLTEQAECEAGLSHFVEQSNTSRRLVEGLALSRVAHAILVSAVGRTESRGAQFRNDYPQRDDGHLQRHSIFDSNGQVVFENW